MKNIKNTLTQVIQVDPKETGRGNCGMEGRGFCVLDKKDLQGCCSADFEEGECETKEYQEEASGIWVPQRMRSCRIR